MLDSAKNKVVQLDLGLENILQEFQGFYYTGTLYDMDVSKGLMGVVEPFTNSSGVEWFEIAADAENVAAEPLMFDAAESFTELSFTCTSAGVADVWIENSLGQTVKTLWTDYSVNADGYSLVWNGTNNSGVTVVPGLYTMKVRVDDEYWEHTSPIRSVELEVLVDPKVITVAVGGGAQYTAIQPAITAANYGDAVLVSNGVYAESIVMRERVAVEGSGADVVISGPGAEHTIRFENLARPGLLKNVEITHAFTASGAGINIFNASPAIEHCIVRDVNVYNGANGGGVRIAGNSAPTFLDCEFRNNRATDGGGVGIWGTGTYSPTASFVDCRFIDNDGKTGKGGAVWLQYATPLDASKTQPSFVGCLFDGNVAADGGALRMEGCYRPQFDSCTFASNTTTSTGYASILSSPTGTGQSGATITKCTFANNSVLVDGSIIGATGTGGSGKTVFVEKSIVAFNSNAAAIRPGFESQYDVKYSDFYGNYSGDAAWLTSGVGNRNLNPAFCDAANGDYRLYAFSPAAAPAAPNPGFFGERVGAFDVGCVPPAVVTVSTPNPFPGNPSLVVGCPQGDGTYWRLDVSVDLNGPITRSIDSTEVVLDVGDCNNVVFFDGDGYVRAGSDAVGPGYATTIAHSHFGGCGTESVDVLLNGFPLAQKAAFTIRTPDFDGNGEAFDINDFAFFGAGFPVDPAINDCRDFNNDAKVNVTDFAVCGAHDGHISPYSPANAPSEVAQSNAGVVLRFGEEYPTATTHRLYVDVDVENFADVTASLFAMSAGSERLTFVEWRQAENSLGTVIFAPVVRDGERLLYFGAVVSETFAGSASNLGRLVFDVGGTEPFEVSEDDFVLTTGEVLLESAGGGRVAAQMTGVMSRTLDPEVARVYHNRLEQNFPNPFNPTTTLAYSLKDGGNVSLTIYDVAGRRVRELVNERRDRGAYKVTWDGQNDSGQIVASGVYFYKLIAGSFTDTKKMTILK